MLLQDLPIQKKLMRFIILISGIVLLTTFSTYFIYDLYRFKKTTVEKLTAIGKIISYNSSNALAFNDHEEAKKILAALSSEPHIIAACLYDNEGKLFAHYPSNFGADYFPKTPQPSGYYFSPFNMETFLPISDGNINYGRLYLKSDLKETYDRLKIYSIISSTALILSLLFAYLFSINLKNSISKPILSLFEAAQTVSEKGDYSVRAIKLEKDELGTLTDTFNQMLDKIDTQNTALNEFNKNLEQKVAERTVSLEAVNKELKESEQHIGSIFNSAPDAVIVINDKSFIEKWNPKAEKLFGWSKSEVLGKPIYELIIPERYREAHKKGMQHYLITGEGPVLNKAFEIEAINKNGIEFTVLLSISPVEIKDKTLFIGFIRDITEKKKAENELKRSNERFLKIFENNAIGMLIIDSETGTYQAANETFLSSFGYTKEEVIGKTTLQLNLIDTAEDENFKSLWKQYGHIRDLETIVRRKNGETFWCQFSAQVLVINGKNSILSSFLDITKRKRAEEIIKQKSEETNQSNNFLDSVLENIPHMIFVKEAKELKFVRFNKAGEELLGYSKQELIGKNDYDFFPKSEADFFISSDRKVFESGKLLEIQEETIHTKNKGERILETKKIPLFDKNGNPIYLLGISNDITEQKKNLIELNKKTQELERSNKELEQFAYIASHDLQEPLRMVNSYLQLLEKRYGDKLGSDAKEFIHYAVDGSNRMRTLIFALLDYSRVNRIKPFENIDLNELLKEVINDLAAQIKENNANITIDPLPEIFGDKVLIGQLFQNLISNAVKFKGPRNPEILISGKLINNEYLFFVKDNGIGIQKEYASKLFTIFQRLNTKEEYPGTGIGLAICKKIVERHGGKIWFESEFGQGSTFYFTIKRKNDKMPPSNDETAGATEPAKRLT